jgi:diguanylate cyclase (GGDEF)-like protein
MGTHNSRLGGFYQLDPRERLQAIKSFDGLCDEDLRQLQGGGGVLTIERADKMIERMLSRVKETLQLLQNSNKLAFSDDISQLPNHRAANLYLEEAAEDYYLYRKPYSVLFIDGDNLKRYNDLGYQQGNNMIRKLGKLITDSIRSSDKVCRWLSGDEFIVILKDTEKPAAYKLAERIRKKVELETINWEYAVTISIGVAECPSDGVDMESIVKKAEKANTLAKRSGKNRVQG